MLKHWRTLNPQALGEMRDRGRIETGIVRKQAVEIEDKTGQPIRWRRIEIKQDEPTEDSERVIRLPTNLPKSRFMARKAAQLYRLTDRIAVPAA